MTFSPVFRFILSIWLLVTLNFILIRMLPGTPLDRLESLSPLVTARLNQEFNFKESQLSQYVSYIKNVIQGDLGPSTSFPGSSVDTLIKEHLNVTMKLNFLALAFVFLLSVGFVWARLRYPNSFLSGLSYFFSVSLMSAPSILLAPVLILILSIKLGWVPNAFLKSTWHFLLPAFVLSVRPAVYLSRSLIGIMEEELGKDYVRTAKAKGIKPGQIIFKHVFKNSVVPVLNLLGPLCVSVLSGSAFVEILFAIQGLGHLFVVSLQERDYFLSSGLVLVFGALLIFLSFFFEILARRLDRRLEGVS